MSCYRDEVIQCVSILNFGRVQIKPWVTIAEAKCLT